MVAWLASGPARAIIEIEITQGGDNAIPIAIVPFGGSAAAEVPEDIAAIVSADLGRSGNFAPLNREDLIANPSGGDTPRFANWRLSGADFLLVGTVEPDGEGVSIEFQLYDVLQQSLMAAYRIPVTDQSYRSVAHRIADEIYEEILGVPGAFNTQIAFVSVEGRVGARQYRLELADADGEGAREMLMSPYPILSPAWAPDGVRIAYVSFEDRLRSAIYIQDRERGVREKVISREGINGAPSFSPDGRRLALTLSEGGSPDIHVLDLASGRLTRVTENAAIDTEAVWIDDETLVYLWHRPVARWKLAMAGTLSATSAAIPLTAIPLSLAAWIASGDTSVALATAVASSFAALAYSALFVLVGLLLRRALIWGLVYLFIWELFIASVGGGSAQLSIRTYPTSILARLTDIDIRLADSSVLTGIIVSIVIGLASVALTAWRLDRMDVA